MIASPSKETASPGDSPSSVEAASHKLSSNAAFTMLARIVYMVTRLFVPPFVLARVGLEAYGIWSTAFLLVGYLGVTTLGVSNVYIKFIAEYNARREYRKANELLSTGLMFTVPVCIVLFLLTVIAWPHAQNILNISPALAADTRATVLMVMAIFLSAIGLCAFSDALAGLQQIVVLQKISMVSFIVETALIYLLVGMGRGIRGMAEAFLVRQVLSVGLSAWRLFRDNPWISLSTRFWSRDALRLLLTYGGVVQAQSLLTTFLSSAERLVGVSALGVEAAGLMDLAKKWPSSVSGIPSSILGALLPAASHLHSAAQDSTVLKNLYLGSSKYLNLTFAFFGGFLCLLAEPIGRVWLGRDVSGLALLMVIMTVTFQVHMLTGAGTSLMNGIGRPGEGLIFCLSHAGALLLCLGAGYLFLQPWSAVTIGLLVSAANIAAALYFIDRSNRHLAIGRREYLREVLPAGVIPYFVALPLAPLALRLTAHRDRWTSAGILAILGLIYSAGLIAIVYRFLLDASARQAVRAPLAAWFAQKPREIPA